MYARSVTLSVSRTLWSVISTPIPDRAKSLMISWRSLTVRGSVPEIHRKIRDFVAVQEDTAGVRPGKSNEDRKRGRFSCTVGPQEPNDFTLSDLQLNVVNDL